MVYYLVLGTCDIQENKVKIKEKAANSITFASVQASESQSIGIALTSQISTVLSKLTNKSSFGKKSSIMSNLPS